jgi:hypothetical protein
MTVIEAYRVWWALTITTLCRALVAQAHPLISTPTWEFIARLDAITPEQEAMRGASGRCRSHPRTYPKANGNDIAPAAPSMREIGDASTETPSRRAMAPANEEAIRP